MDQVETLEDRTCPDINKDITITALRDNTRNVIAGLLDSKKIIPTETGLLRDWKGLAELCGIRSQEINAIEQYRDPTCQTLNKWKSRDGTNSTIANLLKFLEKMDRWDVIDDAFELIEEDILYYQQTLNDNNEQFNLDEDENILTMGDIWRKENGLELQQYDAFVLFAQDANEFATKELIETLEKKYNLNLCYKDRDLAGGVLEIDSITTLILKRCHRVIVILSPAFYKSFENKFFCKIAQADGIKKEGRKIIPILYKSCTIPSELQFYHLLDYERNQKFWNFWAILYNSLKAPNGRRAINQAVKVPTSPHLEFEPPSKPEPLIKTALHHGNSDKKLSSLKPNKGISLSMGNLSSLENVTSVPEKNNMVASNSANCLDDTTNSKSPNDKKRKSFYNKIKNIITPKAANKDTDIKAESKEEKKIKKKKFRAKDLKRIPVAV